MHSSRALRFMTWVGFIAGLLAAALPALAAKGAKPEFGPNVLIFDSSMPAQAIQKQIDAVYATQEHNEFGPQRHAFLFLPGSYSVDVPVGFYTEVMGLGASPDATRITGNMHADANHEHNNATTTFWRAAEGISIAPAGGTMQWAVSQAVSLRRMHVRGDLVLHQKHGWASGGWMSDSLVDGNVDSGSQQQWISRNCDWKSWTGCELEHGVCRRSASAGRSVAFAAVHHSGAYARGAREAVPASECRGRIQRAGSGTVPRQRGDYVARRGDSGRDDSNCAVLYCAPGCGYGGDDQRAA